MKIILDSCAFIDIAINAATLSDEALSIYQNEDNELYLSVATVWELGLKRSLGKLDFDIVGAVDLLSENGINILDITLPVSLLVNQLPYHHKDPFDRIIIATAKCNNADIITSDAIFTQYDVNIIDSRNIR
ncbi:MAG: type II toxin-antitoxin system VapC family toxin [Emcibacteraceae bacterium]|nr:type II toxin-antitoxin system VapC family toxin [Emcibacteraceae bacterium]MDG1996681.1 type II toxin-antitoxin system VapC family toxin [Emcibacteraceae bacterium]